MTFKAEHDEERGEYFPSSAEEAAAEEAQQWFDECAQHAAVLAVRLIIREAKSDKFDPEQFYDAVIDCMQGQDVWAQAEVAEMTADERRADLSLAVKEMLGGA